MNTTPSFAQLPYQRPNTAEFLTSSAALLARLEAAETAEIQRAIVMEWDTLRRSWSTQKSIAEVHYQQDTASEQAKTEQEFYDTAGPEVMSAEVDFLKVLTTSPHRSALEASIGQQAFALWDCTLTTFEPAIADDQRAEASLRNQYNELMAAIRIELDGETHTLSTIRGTFGDADRGVRAAAMAAMDGAMADKSDALDALYHKLVGCRHQMAGKLGYDSFTELGYRKMLRTDYTHVEVAQFRAEIQAVLVPLAARIRARQAAALGVSDYAYHDEAVRDLQGVPCPKGDASWMLDQASTLFERMGPDFDRFFSMMRRRDLLDLESRDGKAGGGFCTSFEDHHIPFIFANFNGTQDDVNVFTHECGHAFQCYSAQRQPLSDYIWPTYEACEVHSMGLELMSWPHMELFFGDDADRFRIGHLEDALTFVPYGTAVDAFQHRVYERPDATPQERAEMWRSVERDFLPWRTYSNMPYAEGGRIWQRQRHIYMSPFYYIDYCLAQLCALQFWSLARKDQADAMQRYRALCDLGGSKPFTELLEAVGLKSPFEPGVVREVVGEAAAFLEL
ncbi:MAG: M3 family oligoendopeptidase [Myxococcota bacterium]|nr:M3 family oligoendopeptidase [Myxococcota bacterium]